MSQTFTIIWLIVESTLKFMNNTRSKGVWSLKWKLFPTMVLFISTICNLQQFRMFFNDFFYLVLGRKGIEPRYGRTRIRGYFSTVRVVSFATCMLTIYVLKHVFIKVSKSGKCFIFTNNVYIKKGHSVFLFTFNCKWHVSMSAI